MLDLGSQGLIPFVTLCNNHATVGVLKLGLFLNNIVHTFESPYCHTSGVPSLISMPLECHTCVLVNHRYLL